MPTEMLTRNTATTDSPAALRGVRSSQKPTVKHEGFDFGDFLNLINPLNYIPGVSHLYQNATGEKANPVSGLIGGALLGGPLGFATAAIGAIFEEATGKGVLSTLSDVVTGKDTAQAGHAASRRYTSAANAHKPDYQYWRESV